MQSTRNNEDRMYISVRIKKFSKIYWAVELTKNHMHIYSPKQVNQ